MKKIVLLFVSLFILVGCASIQPNAIEFNAAPTSIFEGDEVRVSWNIENAKTVSIEGIGKELLPAGSKSIRLFKTTTFKLLAYNGDKSLTLERIVVVNPKVVEKPKSFPAIEKKNETKTSYVKGVVNAENVKASDNPQLYINLIDTKNYPEEVKLYCTVKDQFGNHIANLAPPYNNALLSNWKSLIEQIEGKDNKISDYSVTEIREDVAPPFTTSFVLDYSGSMENDFQFVNNAITKAVKYLRPQKDDYEVFQFDHRVFKPIENTKNSGDISKLIPFEQLSGYTAFYTASMLALTDIDKSAKEKVSILFTDGGDNASLNNAYDIILKARSTNSKVFIIGFSREFGGFQTNILESIAEQTGGKAYFPKNIQELDEIFAEIYQIMNVYYIITYKTTKSNSNIVMAKLNLEFPNIDKQLVAQKKYFIQPEPIQEERMLTVAWFDNAKSEIMDEFKPLIQNIANFLVENPNKKIIISGHTDTKGSDVLNNSLSFKRAKALSNILVKLGVKKNQISKIEGKGKTQPIYPSEQNDQQRKENRRVDLKII